MLYINRYNINKVCMTFGPKGSRYSFQPHYGYPSSDVSPGASRLYTVGPNGARLITSILWFDNIVLLP